MINAGGRLSAGSRWVGCLYHPGRASMADEERSSSGWNGNEAGRPGSSEAVNRQLRRRYESLRDDYDELLDRLAELEGRLQKAEQPVGSQPASERLSLAVSEAITAPLFALRDQYALAAAELSALAEAVEDLGWRTFKGQRGSSLSTPGADAPARSEPAHTTTVEVQADSSDLGKLLDFQEQVGQLACVARVSLSQVRDDRATLTVELL